MLRRIICGRWLLTLAGFAAIGVFVTSSALAQSTVPVRPAVQTIVDSSANPIRTADLKASDRDNMQAQPVRWGWGGYRGYAPYRGYYPGRYYSSYYGAPYTYYNAAPYYSYYSAPYTTYYPRPYYYGSRVAVRPYARWW
jgi:hypothetical protein